jgi:uncharacterized glyoxalase superfamily protein PhnB
MNPELVTLAVDSHHGRYAYQVLLQKYDVANIDRWVRDAILAGPDHDDYWEAAILVEEIGYVIDDNGIEWTIGSVEGDIFLFHPDCEPSELEVWW